MSATAQLLATQLGGGSAGLTAVGERGGLHARALAQPATNAGAAADTIKQSSDSNYLADGAMLKRAARGCYSPRARYTTGRPLLNELPAAAVLCTSPDRCGMSDTV